MLTKRNGDASARKSPPKRQSTDDLRLDGGGARGTELFSVLKLTVADSNVNDQRPADDTGNHDSLWP